MIFDSQSLHDAVSRELESANVPADRHNAFTVIATRGGVKGVLTTKIDDVWQISGVVSVDGQKHVDGGVEVKATW